jgi:glutamate dehydrogenase/leucine dehydrogenase
MLVASVKRGKPLDAPAFCFLVFPQFSAKVVQTVILTGATVILQGFGEVTLVCCAYE